jgi:large subunit ribosomal protein L9
MKVLFIKNCPGHGQKGEVKEVSSGFAQNFLIKKGFAQLATEGILQKLNKEEKEMRAKKEKEQARIAKIIQDAQNKIFTVPVKVGAKGQIFGSIDGKALIEQVNKKLGTNYVKSDLVIPHGITKLGEYKVELKAGNGNLAVLKVNVTA